MISRLNSLVLLTLLFACGVASGEKVDYLRQIKPLLKQRCFACHGVLRQQSNLRLDSGANILKGGDGGTGLVPGNPDESELIARLSSTDDSYRMPPEGEPLKPAEISVFRKWIREGATFPSSDQPEADPKSHWSYRPVVRPAVPSSTSGWGNNAIDQFIERSRDVHGLKPSSPARPEVLLRRVYLDLIGIPPTAEELDRFLANPTSQAYEQIVDDLLQRPQYGERWGRHWMDVWRYSDWYGRRNSNEIRYSQRHIWRWRDWIIESVNADKGYDRMILEMLAGDELAPLDKSTLRATGFLGRNWYKFDRDAWLFDTVEHTAAGLLAMTAKCARCHDHKYDPISHDEYYRLRAFFEPHGFRVDAINADTGTVIDNGKEKVLTDGLSRVYDKELSAVTYRLERGDNRQPDKSKPLSPNVPAILGVPLPEIRSKPLPAQAYYPALRPQLIASKRNALTASIKTAQRQLGQAELRLKQLRQRLASGQPVKQAKPRTLWKESFSTDAAANWIVKSGQWDFQKGSVTQKQLGTFLTLLGKQDMPRNFSARLVYRTLKKGKIRSVGVSFDTSTDLRHWQAIYTHVNSTSAVHAFHRIAGKDTYPASAIVDHPIKLDEWITLDFAVRDQWLNIWVDGKLVVVHEMKAPRRDGALALWVHAGTAEWREIEIRALPDETVVATKLTADLNSPFEPPTKDQLMVAEKRAAETIAGHQLSVQIAEAAKRAFEAQLAAEQQRVAKSTKDGDEDTLSKLAHAAVLAEQELGILQARKMLRAEEGKLSQTGSDEKKRKVAQTAVAAAMQAIAKAKSTLAATRKAAPGTDATKWKYQKLGAEYPATTTGRRLAFAQWMVDPRNPRTSRVAVNHIWLRHFGQPLVESVSDFGLNGKTPSHPDLLDWLGAELVDHDWSMKHIHRLMVSSSTYKMESTTAPRMARIDAANRWYWRMPAKRMEAEVVRDSLLAVASWLDLSQGGADLDDAQVQSIPRRSVYFRTTPDNKTQLLEIFDLANPNACYRRQSSIVPQQALAISNSPLAQAQARRLARRLNKACDGEDEFIIAAFKSVLTRLPSLAEIKLCKEFLQSNSKLLDSPEKLTAFPASSTTGTRVAPAKVPGLRARENLVHVLFSHNDFVTIR